MDISRLWDILQYDASAPMIFSSGTFFILFLLFLPLYILLRRQTGLRIVYVSLFSLYFYYKSSGLFVLLLLAAATSDFLIGRLLSRQQIQVRRKLLVALSMCINLGVLSYFKYFNFLGEMLFSLIQEIGLVTNRPEWIMTDWEHWDIILPVGISFYTLSTFIEVRCSL